MLHWSLYMSDTWPANQQDCHAYMWITNQECNACMWRLVWIDVMMHRKVWLIMTAVTEWIHTHKTIIRTLYKLHETLHDLHTYIHAIISQNAGIDSHALPQGDNWWRAEFFTTSPSHAMSLAVMTYMHTWTDNFLSIPNFLQHDSGHVNVPKRDNFEFPGNNDPYTVTPSTRVTGSINDTRSCIHVVAGLGWCDA